MTHLLTILFLLLACVAQGAGLGPYNPAQHAVNGFMPTQVPGLQMWFDAGRLCFTNGASVAAWRDFGGNGWDATNSTASQQPVVSSINGRQTVRFDGTDDILYPWKTAKSWLSNRSDATIYIVANKVGAASNDRQWTFYTATPGDLTCVEVEFIHSKNEYVTGGRRTDANAFQSLTNSQTGNLVVTAFFDFANANLILEGNRQTTNRTFQTSGNTYTNSAASMAIGQGFNLPFNGHIGELICFANSSSSANRLQLQRYLGTKYGIVVK